MPPISELLKSNVNRLILINVVIYFVLEALFAQQSSLMQGTGYELYYWQNPSFQPWQLISHMFLHGSVPHLFFNMFGLWMFGRVLEKIWGSQKFLTFYLLCGFGAALIHLAVTHFQFQSLSQQILAAGMTASDIDLLLQTGRDISVGSATVSRETVIELYRAYNAPTVGASGAIYGILIAFAMLFPNSKLMLIFLPVPVAAKYFVPVLLLIDLTGGLTGFSIFGHNIAHFAHIGGAVVGFLLIKFWLKQRGY